MTKTTKKNQKENAQDFLIQTRNKSLRKNTEEMLNQEIEKTEVLRSQFLSNVSHELKTPLNSIISAVSLLNQKSLDFESRKLLETIHQSSQYLSTILNSVLDYYKLTYNQLSLDHLNFDLFSLLNELDTFFSKKAREKGLQLSFETSNDLPHYLTGDEMRLKQILTKLLDNALKFTVKGGVKLWTGLHSEEGKRKHLCFRISDSGIGINSLEVENFWKSFTMGNMAPSRENQGIGMGLALSKRLCQLMDGDLYIKETSAKGTTFELIVTLDSGIDMGIANNPSSKIIKILLAEDNLINQKLTQNLLTNHGFMVDVAENGQVAVEKFKKYSYDLILMDIQMPVLDGINASRQIRKLEAERTDGRRVKIIALTANALKQDKADCLTAGMDEYISKPINPNEIPAIFGKI